MAPPDHDSLAHAYTIAVQCEAAGRFPVASPDPIITEVIDIRHLPSNITVEHRDWLTTASYHETRDLCMSIGILVLGITAMAFDLWALVLPWLSRLDPQSGQVIVYYLLNIKGTAGHNCPDGTSFCDNLEKARRCTSAFIFLSLFAGLLFNVVCFFKTRGRFILNRPWPQIICVSIIVFKAIALGLWTGYIPKSDEQFCGGDAGGGTCKEEYGYMGAWAGLLLAFFTAIICLFARDHSRGKKFFLRGPRPIYHRDVEVINRLSHSISVSAVSMTMPL